MSRQDVTRTIEPSLRGEHPYRIVRRPGGNLGELMPPPVQRWDIYDTADSLADIPTLIARHADNPAKLRVIARYIQLTSNQLFRMSRITGSVNPAPNYTPATPTSPET